MLYDTVNAEKMGGLGLVPSFFFSIFQAVSAIGIRSALTSTRLPPLPGVRARRAIVYPRKRVGVQAHAAHKGAVHVRHARDLPSALGQHAPSVHHPNAPDVLRRRSQDAGQGEYNIMVLLRSAHLAIIGAQITKQNDNLLRVQSGHCVAFLLS